MEFQILPHNDYDRKVKIEKQKFFCFSKKLLKRKYPNDDFHLVGETRAHNRKRAVGKLPFGEKVFVVSGVGEHSKILNRTAGYVHVGEDDYIVLLKSRIPFLLWLFFLLLGIAAAGILLFRLWQGPKAPAIDPYHPLPEEDSQAESIQDDHSQKAQSEKGGGSVSMIYTLKADLSLSGGSISMHFKNPGASNHDVVLELYILSDGTETKIAQSGRIRAGYGLYEMQMDREAAVLQEGIYQGKYKVLYYDPDTGERALIESDITDLEITVTP